MLLLPLPLLFRRFHPIGGTTKEQPLGLFLIPPTCRLGIVSAQLEIDFTFRRVRSYVCGLAFLDAGGSNVLYLCLGGAALSVNRSVLSPQTLCPFRDELYVYRAHYTLPQCKQTRTIAESEEC